MSLRKCGVRDGRNRSSSISSFGATAQPARPVRRFDRLPENGEFMILPLCYWCRLWLCLLIQPKVVGPYPPKRSKGGPKACTPLGMFPDDRSLWRPFRAFHTRVVIRFPGPGLACLPPFRGERGWAYLAYPGGGCPLPARGLRWPPARGPGPMARCRGCRRRQRRTACR